MFGRSNLPGTVPALLMIALAAGAVAACGPGGPATTVPLVPLITALPDPTPEVTPVPLPVTKIDGAGTVARGGTATVTVDTLKGAECSIDVQYDSGSGTTSGLGSKTANADGRVKWSWTVGSNTTNGSVPIVISCSKGERSGELNLTLTVK